MGERAYNKENGPRTQRHTSLFPRGCWSVKRHAETGGHVAPNKGYNCTNKCVGAEYKWLKVLSDNSRAYRN